MTYRIVFYEGGKFSTCIGRPYDRKDSALFALGEIYADLSRLFPVNADAPDSLTYDRYGTPCMIRIEKIEDTCS